MAREDITLLEALREDLGARSVKDGCSPQGQCGCCTVLIDGSARVSCVTPVRRVAGRRVITADGLDADVHRRLTGAFLDHGASQCGFCTPGILCRLAGLPGHVGGPEVENALLAHLCRCTGWRSVVEAALVRAGTDLDTAGGSGAALACPAATGPVGSARSARATLEGGVPQEIGPASVDGGGGFADDLAPEGCLVALPRADAEAGDLERVEGWSLGATLAEARAGAGKVQGRRSGHSLVYPVDVPPGDWDISWQTTWVEPAYLEPDGSWCRPGGTPASPLANGGAFGAKSDSPVPAAARLLADHHGQPVRVLFSREDVVRFGSKRPPVGAGIRLDGTGVVLLGTTEAGLRQVRQGWRAPPGLELYAVEVPGPATSVALRAAGWAEVAVLAASAAALAAGTTTAVVTTREGAGATASVELGADGWPRGVHVEVDGGDPLDETVLRSYVQGAAHMALGWVCSEGIAVDDAGRPSDLTIRSFGILRAKDTPDLDVVVRPGGGRPPVRVSDAAFAAVAAATWLAQGLPSRWPTMRGARR